MNKTLFISICAKYGVNPTKAIDNKQVQTFVFTNNPKGLKNYFKSKGTGNVLNYEDHIEQVRKDSYLYS